MGEQRVTVLFSDDTGRPPEALASTGLRYNHAYALLDADVRGGRQQRQLYNPHGPGKGEVPGSIDGWVDADVVTRHFTDALSLSS